MEYVTTKVTKQNIPFQDPFPLIVYHGTNHDRDVQDEARFSEFVVRVTR